MAVQGGAEPGATYGALAERFKGSEHPYAYEARAGTRSDGVLAAVAIPAVLKTRAKRAEAAMEAVPPVLALPD